MICLYKVKGNLKRHYSYWKEVLRADDFILQLIEKGYKIPFRYLPAPRMMNNNNSALRERDFVEKSIIELLRYNRIYEVEEPYMISPLSVAQDSRGKKRLILDLTYVNKFVWKEKIKFDDWKIFEQFVEADSGGFLFKFDLKSGYHHVDIHKNFQKFLGFSWTFPDGTKRFFQFAVLPFGLTSGPYIFTKIVRTMVRYWRSFSIKIGVFLDDGLSIEYDENQAKKNSKFVQKSLHSAGFVENIEKSEWKPKTSIEWLGVVLDFTNKTYKISDRRICSIVSSLENIFSSPTRVSARQLARLAGKIISTKFVLGNIVRLKTRKLYKAIENRVSWDKKFSLCNNIELIDDLLFWKLNIVNLNKRMIVKYSIPFLKIYSDASSTGIGAIFENNVCYRNLDNTEKGESSTYRELLAILHSINSFDRVIVGKNILWHTDNMAAATIVRVGSSKPKLQDLANKIFQASKEENLNLKVTWIARDKNYDADLVSKTIDYDDWTVNDNVFHYLQNIWGKFTIDLFADNKNTKCKKFCSRYWCPNTFMVDAFSFDWSNEHCFIAPPTYLIAKSIRHFLASEGKVTGVILIPHWPSANFWPFLVGYDKKFKNFVKNFLYFENSENVIITGEYERSLLGNEKKVAFYALLIEN